MRSLVPLALLLILTPPTAFAAPAAVPSPPAAKPTVRLDYQNVPLRTALQQLFQGSGRQFAVEPAVPNYPITLDIRGVPFDTALATLLRLAPGVTYRLENGRYIFGLGLPPAAAPSGTPGVVELDLPAAVAGQVQAEVHIDGNVVTVSGDSSEISGDVLVRFGNGARLTTHGARVRLEKDPSTGGTRIIIEPFQAAPTP